MHDGVWAPERRALTVGMVATITLVAAESLSVATVLPLVGRELGHIELYGWLFSAFFLASLVGIAVAGRLADRTALALPLLGGLTCFAAGLAVGGLARSMVVLIAGRALQGLGAGAVPAAAYVAIGRAYPERSRPQMFAVLSTAWVVPGVVGPSIAAVVGDAFGWRWVFLGLVPLAAVVAATSAPALRRVPAPTASHDGEASGTTLRAALTALGAGAVLAGLSSRSPGAAAALVVVGGALTAVALRGLLPPGTFRVAAGLPAAVAVRGLLTFGYFGVDAYVPLTLVTDRHAAPAVGGAALTASTLTWTIGAWLQARLVGTWGARRLVALGSAVTVAGGVAFAVTLIDAVPPWVGIPACGVGGLGMGLAYAPLSLTTLELAPAGAEGRSAAALQLTDTLGTALGTGAAGAAVALGQRAGWPGAAGLAVAFAVATAGALGATVGALRLPARARARLSQARA